MKKWLIVGGMALVCAAFLSVLWGGFGRNPHEVPFMLLDKPAPDFTLPEVMGGPDVQLASLKGRPVVINFWASWCGPCKMEHPVLEWGAKQFGQQAQFLGVVFEDTQENAEGYLKRNGAAYPQLLDPRGATAVDYGAAGVPETYFIDAAGVIRHKHIGPISPPQLREQITRLVQGTPRTVSATP
jgi:cytochrome c biogenesis protein CcmG/thiol:disulfide interchange protein DsbE